MNNLLNAIEDIFEKCSVNTKYLIKLTDNAYTNLGYASFLLQLLYSNFDTIENSKTRIISDIIGCLYKRFNDYYDEIIVLFDDKITALTLKNSMFDLMLKIELKLYEIVYNNEGDVQKNSESNDPLYKINKK